MFHLHPGMLIILSLIATPGDRLKSIKTSGKSSISVPPTRTRLNFSRRHWAAQQAPASSGSDQSTTGWLAREARRGMGYLRHRESLPTTGSGAKCSPERRPRGVGKRLQFDDADVGVAAFDAQEELRKELESFIGRFEFYNDEDREEYWKPAGMKMQYVKGNFNSYQFTR